MHQRKRMIRILAIAMAMAGLFVPASSPASTSAGDHVMYIDGTSSISGYCQYEWKTVSVTRLDPNTGQTKTFLDPVRDELGIPQPTTLPPTCRTGAGTNCTIQRNLGTYKPYWRGADLTQGEVGLNPPCAGQISANTDLLGGCVDATNGDTTCRINAPTWFYGYCGQTYGGAVGGTLKFQNQIWTIDRMGFPRGRGAWEFSGKISHKDPLGVVDGNSKIRFYFAALPDKAEESAACDTGGNLTRITFNGMAIISNQLPVRVIRPKPGWHFCADDPIIGVPGTEGC